jgi:uncharacterized protein (TIGR02677 family)
VHPSQATLLRQRARKAIPDLLATISVLQERRAGRSDRSADFRALAQWFAQAPSEDDAHRLWRAAFGLSSARHFTGEPPAGTETSRTAPESWLDAEPLMIAARLRSTGKFERRGGPLKIRDRAAERDELAREVAAERDQTQTARRRLATGRTAKLSDLGELDQAEFALFLRVLGEALSSGPPDHDGAIKIRTADGMMETVLRPLANGSLATITTPDGTLTGPDHELTITDLTEPPPAAEPAEPAEPAEVEGSEELQVLQENEYEHFQGASR